MPHPYDPQIERTMRFSNTYFQNCISEWNRLDVSDRSCTTISEFKKRLLLHIRPSKRSIFDIHDLTGIKLLTRLRVECSDLHEHRFRHNFYVQAQSAHAKQVMNIMNTSSCTAHAFLPIEETSLTCSLDPSILTCTFLLRS